MFFQNPIGLLGLLALPTILFLHYFRSQRRQIRVGGLHLWEFARRQLPTGRVWRRVFMTLPLLLELLAALALTLWLSGLTWRAEPERKHAVVALDSSASMLARDASGRSAAEKAAGWILNRADANTRWTIVSAGLEPEVLAGPLATSEQVRERLEGWSPSAPAAGLAEATRFAVKFGEPNQPVIVLTDSNKAEEELKDIAELQSFGQAAPNWTIVFADRFRATPTSDRVFALVRRQGGSEGDQTTLSLSIGGGEGAQRAITLNPGETTRLEFEITALEAVVRLSLPDDALAIDNEVVLAPAPPRRVLAGLALRQPVDEYARRAIEALPETYLTDDLNEARLFITDQIAYRPPPKALVTLQLSPPIPSEDLGAATEGFFADRRSPIAAGLTFEGLIWMFDAKAQANSDDQTRLRAGLSPLIIEKPKAGRSERFFINTLPENGNLARSTVWPLLIYNAAGMVRERLPGLKRSNFRVGEEIDPGLDDLVASVADENGEDASIPWTLAGPDGERTFERAPSALAGLGPGFYELFYRNADGEKSGYRFAVNFFAPDEGDLASMDSSSRADFRKAVSPGKTREAVNPIAYYLPLAILCALLAWLWKLQERGAGF